ncbi:MAG TPA: SUMF1/EgtB/PvdO family nonheme iron enzyme [Sedimentisphaerales bacterium]|nr:SUMF1/EgtB/PvdO family nonheme iron enzyme [Sedimentisphaerales bacterium]
MVTRQIRLIGVFLAVLCGVTAGANSLLLAKESGTRPVGSETTPKIETQAGDRFSKAAADLEMVNLTALRRTIRDLMKTFPTKYTKGEDYLKALEHYKNRLPKIKEALKQKDKTALKKVEEIVIFQREALLANPLLNFDRLLLIKRKPLGDPRRAKEPDRGIGKFVGMPQQSSWQLHTMPNTDGWDNEICVLSKHKSRDSKLKTVYRPPGGRLVSEMDLHFDGEKLMFSMPDNRKFWQVFEINIDGTQLRQVSDAEQHDVHNFDSCYLPNGKIAYISTAPFQGVPCNASVNVGMMYLMDTNGRNIRQVCFEQDHNFCPTVMNDGRILYLRWEYTDIPHVWARFLFTMNPDGTCQREHYGSGGYWPNAIFFARPIPGHPSKVVGIATGHHVGRVGELVIFDPALGRMATDGVVQRIPGYGKKVKPLIQDKLAMECWPKFLHPWPLSDKYFIVSCKPRPYDLWGIYLVDVFDNVLLLKEVENYALLEPIPLRKMKRPPVIAERIDLKRKDALVYLENIYEGPGLKGVPRGAVKKLRLFTYHFAYHRIAGINHRVGADGPWEPKRILGTVPVEKDGSAMFRVPANTPISIQPIDAKGKALQLMRSWMTAMPGEIVSCVGCHEKQNAGPPNLRTIASRRQPFEIEPWYGPARGFSFRREVQPVLDKYCISCHNGSKREDGQEIADLRGDQGKFIAYKNGKPKANVIYGVPREELVKKYGGVFEPSYITLRSFVRVGGLESDLRLLAPGEFHAETTELVQMLMKGHYGVELDAEAWERITIWIDLNAPCHGTWREVVGLEKTRNDHKRRLDLRKLYGASVEDPEAYPAILNRKIVPIKPRPIRKSIVEIPHVRGWPFDTAEAKCRQGQASLGPAHRTIDLGSGVKLEMVFVPAGQFVMGDQNGHDDERPVTAVKIEKPFWIGQFEITNEQYARFDPFHDSKYEHKGSWMFEEWDLGWDLNHPKQPVVRISWKEAVAFCRWLSDKTGQKVSLPTEAQWEWACRAGTDTPLHYGDLDTDFSEFGNMADFTIRELVYGVRDQYPPDLVPRDARFNDKKLVTANVGSYKPNTWGLQDMHGNVWEWTRSRYRPYPYRPDDGRNDIDNTGRKVVRGGSWYDRPKRCRSAYRLSYPAWQKVYNVGFRVVLEPKQTLALAAEEEHLPNHF